MIGGKLNLAKLEHVLMEKKGQNGMVECIVIPIAKNHLFKGKDGNIYLDLIAFDLKEQKDGNTHLIKQSLPKEVREKMSKEEQNAMPVLGNLSILGGGDSKPNNAAAGVMLGDEDDLPF